MKKYILRFFCLFLVGVFSFVGCTQQEDWVEPNETCDTMATVQMAPSCGLQLVLENNQILIPVNVDITTGPADQPIYKINGFIVEIGQQIIIGYKASGAHLEASPCNHNGYYNNKLVDVTCVVSIEQRT